MDRPQVWLTPPALREIQNLIDQYKEHKARSDVFNASWEEATDLLYVDPFKFELHWKGQYATIFAGGHTDHQLVMDKDIYDRLISIFRSLHQRQGQLIVAKLEQYGVDIEGKYTDTK